jgi:hypothetical protein
MTSRARAANRTRMGAFRQTLTCRRGWAIGLVLLALMTKILVPAGYMPVFSGGAVMIELCSGAGPEKMMMAMPGMDDRRGKADHSTDRSDKGDMPCGFAGHAPAAAMAGADPVLLAVAIALIVATVFRLPVAWRVRSAAHLRPPLRGPPAIA